MELNREFQETDLGRIPSEWTVKPLGELGEALIGLTYAPSDVAHDGILVLRSSNVHDGTLRFEDNVFVKKAVPARIMVKEGDILICVRNGSRNLIGKAALIDERARGMTFGAFMAVFRTSFSRFVYHQITSDLIKRQIHEHLGATINQITNKSLNSFRIPFPEKEYERESIASALSDVDALLGALDRLIAKKRDIKQAAMQQLLTGQTRLPGFGAEWHDTTLGDIGECVIGLTYSPENVVEHGLLVLRSSNVQNNRLAFEDNVYVNLKVPEHLVTRPGDILVCVRNGSRSLIGKCALIDERFAGLSFGAFMSVFRTRYWRFVFHAFQSHGIQRQIRDNIGATINQITNKDMRALRIALPPEDEQNTIAEVLSDMDAELTALEQRRDKTRLLKQGMMQELLTGRTRLV